MTNANLYDAAAERMEFTKPGARQAYIAALDVQRSLAQRPSDAVREAWDDEEGRDSGRWPPGWWIIPGFLFGLIAWAVIFYCALGLVQLAAAPSMEAIAAEAVERARY